MQKGLAQIKKEQLERKKQLGQWCNEFVTNECVLEIGSGHGDFLVEYAAAHKDDICVGLDIMNKRLEKSRKKAERKQLANLHFLKARGEEFIEAFPKDLALSKVYILYPDPWPKRCHHKNRLIQDPFLADLAKKMTSGGQLYFRTDHQGYWNWIVQKVEASEHWNVLPDADWGFEVETFFERVMGGACGKLIAQRC